MRRALVVAALLLSACSAPKGRDSALGYYDKPHQFAPGVKWLYVNGTATIADGTPTRALAGLPLRHEDLKR